MLLLIVILIFALLLIELMHWRNNRVIDIRHRALFSVHRRAILSIRKGESWYPYYQRFNDNGSYFQMVLDFRKWNYNHFYPDIPE